MIASREGWVSDTLISNERLVLTTDSSDGHGSGRFDTGLDPIRAHPRNPWLEQLDPLKILKNQFS